MATTEAIPVDERKVDPAPEHFTLRFREGPIQRDAARGTAALVVNVELQYPDDAPGYVADLILSLDEWDRIWGALVYATGAFERRAIQLERVRPPERI